MDHSHIHHTTLTHMNDVSGHHVLNPHVSPLGHHLSPVSHPIHTSHDQTGVLHTNSSHQHVTGMVKDTLEQNTFNQIQLGDCDTDTSCLKITSDKGLDHNNVDIYGKYPMGNTDIVTHIHHHKIVGDASTHGDVCINYHNDPISNNLCYNF